MNETTTILETLLRENLNQSNQLGQLMTKLEDINQGLRSLDRRLENCSLQIQSHGTELGSHGAEIRNLQAQILGVDTEACAGFRRHSEMIRCLSGKAESSEVYIVQQNTVSETKRRWLATAAKAMAILIALCGTLGIGHCLDKSMSSAQNVITEGSRR